MIMWERSILRSMISLAWSAADTWDARMLFAFESSQPTTPIYTTALYPDYYYTFHRLSVRPTTPSFELLSTAERSDAFFLRNSHSPHL